jgi:hypothetical protein
MSRATLDGMSHTLRKTITLAVAAPVVATALSGCGGDKPAVCSSLDDMKSSVQTMSSVPLGDGVVDAVRTGVGEMRTAVAQLKADADGEFSSEITAVSGTLSIAANAVTTASADPSASTVAQVAVAVKNVADAGRGLVGAVEDTC